MRAATRFFITNAYGNASSPVLPLTVTQAPVVNGTTTSGPAALGGTVTFTAFVEGAPTLLLQWDFEPGDGTTNALPGATNSILTITNVASHQCRQLPVVRHQFLWDRAKSAAAAGHRRRLRAEDRRAAGQPDGAARIPGPISGAGLRHGADLLPMVVRWQSGLFVDQSNAFAA